MTAPLKLYQIHGSPNSRKVRIALAYKGLAYEKWDLPMDTPFPFDRSELVRVSTQARTPVLTHGETVMFDSGGILRYLDANFPDTPRIFSADYAEEREIETWEMYARTHLGPPVGAIFGQATGGAIDPEVTAAARAQMLESTGKLEARLSEHDYLVGDSLTIADICCAPAVGLAVLTEGREAGPVMRTFFEHFQLGSGRDKTRAWAQRVLAYDRG